MEHVYVVKLNGCSACGQAEAGGSGKDEPVTVRDCH
jgi:hypothetical protein